MRNIKILFIVFFSFWSVILLAQAQVNDNCSGAIPLNVGSSNSCSPTLVTIDNNVTGSGVADPGCANYVDGDLWYKLTMPATGGVRIETSSTGSINDTGMAVYSGSCASLSLIRCNDDILTAVNTFSGLNVAEPSGTTVYIRVWKYGGGTGTFNICAFETTPPPVANNDDCSTATLLTLGSTCTTIVGSNNATNSEDIDPTIPGAGCARYNGSDVWYKLIVPSSGHVIIETYENDLSITDGGLAVYSGTCNSGELALLKCNDDGNFNSAYHFERIEFTGLQKDQELFIRVWSYNNSELGTFKICAIDTGSLNDDDDNDGFSENDGDCNDGDSSIYPNATEICDGIDNNCDGNIDEGLTTIDYYPDLDGDGYGDSSAVPTSVCSALQPAGYLDNALDCDDSNASINPDATEVCDGVDNDCDGLVDDDDPSVTGQTTYYVDVDEDGYGDINDTGEGYCSDPGTGYSLNNDDCDDSNASINPEATEVPDNGIDEDCDGADLKTWYLDSDGDTFGDINAVQLSNTQPLNYVADNTDCDDGNVAINPNATEIPENGIDENCDGYDSNIWYADTDMDNYGDPDVSQVSITQPFGFVSDNTDCNDTDSAINPDATEVPDNEIDEDCDGFDLKTWYQDSDGDNYGNPDVSQQSNTKPIGYVSDNTDCDDTNDLVNTPQQYYVDADLDGFGSVTTTMLCESSAPSGYSTNNTDCDDGDPAINPDATEIAGNGIDEDCNPLTEDTLTVDDFNLKLVKIHPVPFKHELFIHLPNATSNTNYEISIFDLLGKTVINRIKHNVDGVLIIKNLENLQQGLYIIKILDIDSRKQVIKRVVKF